LKKLLLLLLVVVVAEVISLRPVQGDPDIVFSTENSISMGWFHTNGTITFEEVISPAEDFHRIDGITLSGSAVIFSSQHRGSSPTLWMVDLKSKEVSQYYFGQEALYRPSVDPKTGRVAAIMDLQNGEYGSVLITGRSTVSYAYNSAQPSSDIDWEYVDPSAVPHEDVLVSRDTYAWTLSEGILLIGIHGVRTRIKEVTGAIALN
jgi:hypothetical protein